MSSEFSARYRWLRHQSRLTQEQFAERILVSRGHVARCELGTNEYTHSELLRIAALLNVPLNWVMMHDENQPALGHADWVANYFRLPCGAKQIFDAIARHAVELARWRG